MGFNYSSFLEMIRITRNQFGAKYLGKRLTSKLFEEDFQIYFPSEEEIFIGTRRDSFLNSKYGYKKIKESKKIPEEIIRLKKTEYPRFISNLEKLSEQNILKGDVDNYSWKLDKLVSKWKKFPLERKKEIVSGLC
jgi:hypothetical protein